MSKHYYIADNTQPRGFVEVSEAEFIALVGDDATRPYAGKVYRGEITIDEVPEELREVVQAVVDARIERFGIYKHDEATIEDYQDALGEFGVEL